MILRNVSKTKIYFAYAKRSVSFAGLMSEHCPNLCLMIEFYCYSVKKRLYA